MTNNDGYYPLMFKETFNFRHIQAKVKYISFEPLLEKLLPSVDALISDFQMVGINWLIIGAQTLPTAFPKIEWVKEIVEAADKAGIPVFLKDNLRTLVLDAVAKHQIERNQFLTDRELRQEMPC